MNFNTYWVFMMRYKFTLLLIRAIRPETTTGNVLNAMLDFPQKGKFLELKDPNKPLPKHSNRHEPVSEEEYKIRRHFTVIKQRIS